MSEKTNIAWCDSTINFWSGCTMVSEGCIHCYAMTRDARMLAEKIIHWGKGAPRLKSKGAVKAALSMNRKWLICDHCGTEQSGAVHLDEGCANPNCTNVLFEGSYHRRRIFSLSLGDWLDEEVPIEWLAEMLDTIRQCDQVIWILCSKRLTQENFWNRMSAVIKSLYPLEVYEDPHKERTPFHTWLADWISGGTGHKNIILLASVENQEQADKRIPELLKIPAVCRGLSVEPMLGPINLACVGDQTIGYQFRGNFYDLACENHCTWAGFESDLIPDPSQPDKDAEANGTNYVCPKCHCESGLVERPDDAQRIDWVIFGGESGDKARPCNVDWIRDGVKQCQAAGVAAFVKQLGARPIRGEKDEPFERVRRKAAAREDCSHELVPNDPKGGDMAEWPDDLRIREFPKL